MKTHSQIGRPKLPLPQPLRGADPDSFPQRTITTRLPSIARRVLKESNWSPEIAASLQALIDSMPHGVLRSLKDDGGPDVSAWETYINPYLGQTWLQPPWFLVETYFFRRILESTGYYSTTSSQGVDPYKPQKQLELATIYPGMHSICTYLDALQSNAPLDPNQLLETLLQLTRINIWGNQADLSMWPGGSGDAPPRPEKDHLTKRLLVDQAPNAARLLARYQKTQLQVDFILDNGGLELAYDLGLTDFLLTSGLAKQVRYHAKPHPTYVSDVTIPDILETITYLEAAPEHCLRALAMRLRAHLESARLELTNHYFWTSPLSGWEMPATLHQELGNADLIISKGDANYRRWLGDRHWPHTTHLSEILAYFPAPLLCLRVIKSNLIAGLPSGKTNSMYEKDPHWLHNGQWGVIQFID